MLEGVECSRVHWIPTRRTTFLGKYKPSPSNHRPYNNNLQCWAANPGRYTSDPQTCATTTFQDHANVPRLIDRIRFQWSPAQPGGKGHGFSPTLFTCSSSLTRRQTIKSKTITPSFATVLADSLFLFFLPSSTVETLLVLLNPIPRPCLTASPSRTPAHHGRSVQDVHP